MRRFQILLAVVSLGLVVSVGHALADGRPPGLLGSMNDLLTPLPNSPGRSVRVLLVDDDTELGELVREYLAREDFSLEVEGDGTRAVDRALSGDYRLIVLDVMLPGVSGFDILRHLRAASRVPVLMLTARGDDVDRIVGLDVHVSRRTTRASPAIAKPCSARFRTSRTTWPRSESSKPRRASSTKRCRPPSAR